MPVDNPWITDKQKEDLKKLEGRIFVHKWLLDEALGEISSYWRYRENDKKHNQEIKRKLSNIYEMFLYKNH